MAQPGERIRYRDPIAAQGFAAIWAVSPWLDDPRLAAFAVRVIAKAGAEHRVEAIEALRRARLAAVAEIGGDIDFALEQLGARTQPTTVTGQVRSHVVPATAGEDWPGFRDDEFGRVAGTSWRSRDGRASLAPVITRALRYQHPDFQSYAVERSPEVHFALRQRYQQGDERVQGWRAAKLFVYAHVIEGRGPATPQIAAGLYVEKSDGQLPFGPLDRRWDWSLFVTSLADPHVRAELGAAMVRHDLSLGDYRFDPQGALVGFVGRFEEGELLLRSADGSELGRGWEVLASRLDALPLDHWHEFVIWKSWPAAEAIAAGRSFAPDALMPVLSELASIYLDVVGPVLPSVSRV